MFIDSVVWIALKYKKDKWHKDATNLRDKILQAKEIYITEPILTETYNFLLRKISFQVAYQTYLDLINSKEVNLIENNSISRIGTKSILNRYKHLSYTDANMVWQCKSKNIVEIMSFDSGFDQVENIARIK